MRSASRYLSNLFRKILWPYRSLPRLRNLSLLFPMRIFISYAAQDREPAKSIYLVLRDQGQRVFFDRADLPAGDEYHNRIREAIQKAHLFIFLLSPNALDADSYTLEELNIAEKTGVKLLPVVLREPAMEQIPVSLKNVTFYRPAGNLAASVAAKFTASPAISRGND